eukprot:scaffold1206_cov184-Ochromonas_danica.AAC.3
MLPGANLKIFFTVLFGSDHEIFFTVFIASGWDGRMCQDWILPVWRGVNERLAKGWQNGRHLGKVRHELSTVLFFAYESVPIDEVYLYKVSERSVKVIAYLGSDSDNHWIKVRVRVSQELHDRRWVRKHNGLEMCSASIHLAIVMNDDDLHVFSSLRGRSYVTTSSFSGGHQLRLNSTKQSIAMSVPSTRTLKTQLTHTPHYPAPFSHHPALHYPIYYTAPFQQSLAFPGLLAPRILIICHTTLCCLNSQITRPEYSSNSFWCDENGVSGESGLDRSWRCSEEQEEELV